MAIICFDYDPLLYRAANICEKKSIEVVHRQSGDTYEFDNRTSFWGEWRAKAGGWLAAYNADLPEDKRRKPEDFDIKDVQEAQPIANALAALNSLIKTVTQSVSKSFAVDAYYGYSGTGKVFREDVSTILKYKGNRDGQLRPLHLDALKKYLVDKHNCQIIEKIEADDACSIDMYSNKGQHMPLVLACVDKDYLQCDGHIFNTDTLGAVEYHSGFGYLKKTEKGKIVGRGRLWLYHQVLSGDTSDNYFANSASEMKWGETSSYKALHKCKNDRQALQALVNAYKLLYPSPKKIIGWRGYNTPGKLLHPKEDSANYEILVDWKYVLNENFNLAKMLRTRDEKLTDVEEVLKKVEVEY